MPLYFAYGSNMDLGAMSHRCPRSRPIGPAHLIGYRFVLMGGSGYASLRADRSATTYGVLFDLASNDVGSLDHYEDVAHGLYSKIIVPVHLGSRVGSRHALVYLGMDKTEQGRPPPGYMEAIVAAAEVAKLPREHVEVLRSLVPADASSRSSWQA